MSSKTMIVLVAALATTGLGLGSSTIAVAQDRQPHHGQLKNTPRPAPGREVQTLPREHETVRVGRTPYHYRDGVFYRPRPGGGFVVVGAPLGARVRILPFGYVSFLIGTRRYYYANFTYYLWDPGVREYVVVTEPGGADKAVAAASEAGDGELFVYPKNGQSDEQRDRDRYECHRWAVSETGFDPSDFGQVAPPRVVRVPVPENKAEGAIAKGALAGAAVETSGQLEAEGKARDEAQRQADELAHSKAEQALRRANYRRAITACLEGRGYTVR